MIKLETSYVTQWISSKPTPLPGFLPLKVILHEITVQLFTSTRIVGRIVVVAFCSRCSCG